MRSAPVPKGLGDRLAGFGVMGMSLADGGYLALRCWPASSFGPGYTAVWHCDGRDWTVFADVPPELSCARFIGRAVQRTVTTPIDLTWSGEDELTVTVASGLTWSLAMTGGARIALLNACAAALPQRAWESGLVLGAMGRMVGPMLSTGPVRMSGVMPNGQQYRIVPRRVWSVRDSHAEIDGRRVDAARRGARRKTLGSLLLPGRGLFYADTSGYFSTLDERV